MILVIDGYNILRALYSRLVTDHERKLFIARLKKYASKKKIEIKLIFDGGIMPWIQKELYGKVLVVYVGKDSTADEYIAEYIEQYRNKELLIVSSDHQIQNYAKQHGIESIDADMFLQFFDKTFHKISLPDTSQKDVIVKVHEEEHAELDRYMREVPMSYQEVYAEEEKMNVKHVAKKLAKKEKKLARLLEKL